VTEDIELYWPKLRPGGIFAGHDYLCQNDLKYVSSHVNQRWDICADESIHPRAVKGAVDDFADKMNLKIAITYDDNPPFLTWIIRKPL
jgi:hypothetical protein